MEEQSHVILRKQMVNGLTLLFSYPNATEWTQIMPGLRVKHWAGGRQYAFYLQLKAQTEAIVFENKLSQFLWLPERL